jgi:hypothetical protein
VVGGVDDPGAHVDEFAHPGPSARRDVVDINIHMEGVGWGVSRSKNAPAHPVVVADLVVVGREEDVKACPRS